MTPAVAWIIGYHILHAVYVLAFRIPGRPVGWVEAITPLCDVSCITAGWLSLNDPYSPLWGIYLYALVGYSRRFHGTVYAIIATFIVANLVAGEVYLSRLRDGGGVDGDVLLTVGVTTFMAMLASAVGDAWREAEGRARLLAETDPLTGIANRRTFLEQLDDLAIEPGSQFSVLMLDLDDFKKLNDEHGHLFGDRVLAAAAAVLSANLRPGDQLARYGGEEFVVVLPGASLEEAYAIAERLRAAVREATPTSVSIGCATREANETAARVVRRADDLLLLAKRTGKNMVVTEQPAAAA
ncbi:MAG: GGDEF domain-containing protein [Hyphomicrobiales bacterium]